MLLNSFIKIFFSFSSIERLMGRESRLSPEEKSGA